MKYPLLIGGCPRSGTTALLQVLNSDPQVHVTSEENLMKLVRDLRAPLGTRERRARTLSNGMRALSVRETLTEDNIHSHNFTGESLWPVVRYLYRWHHQQLHPGQTLKLWGDKFPGYAAQAAEVAAMPGIRYVHLTRCPLDVVDSMLRRTEMAKQGRDWWRAITDFDAMLAAWVEAWEGIRRIEGRANVLHIHYEELAFDFDATLRRLAAFAGVALECTDTMVSEPARHFERRYLDAAQRTRIVACPAVRAYAEGLPDAARLAWDHREPEPGGGGR
jgi:hypothetical protein